jgi:hypothetical protein
MSLTIINETRATALLRDNPKGKIICIAAARDIDDAKTDGLVDADDLVLQSGDDPKRFRS